MSTTNANFQDSFLSGILPVKNQERNLCPILMSAYCWCQWKSFVTWTWTILPVQPEICLYQIQGLGLFWLLHTLSPASGQFFTSTDQMYHRKFSSKMEEWQLTFFDPRCVEGPGITNTIPRSFLWLLYTWREIYTGIHWLRCNFQHMFIIRRYQSAFWQGYSQHRVCIAEA